MSAMELLTDDTISEDIFWDKVGENLMFTIKLVSNSKDKVIYDIWNGDTKKCINQIEVNKRNLSYRLKNNQKLSNSYEAGAYRAIMKAIKDDSYPEQFSNGWI
ncbi:hypothetical protein ABZU09_06560 [Lactobacillus mulieris]|jgi:hypothetical protein|nr:MULTISPECIES: hypothetical protein [Lactobacillus]EEX24467.1 hypothetical protein HMPREF0974_00272 [Lactobacillus jensenii 115-3-CHN]EFH29643.1 hypothetical protein HMPREF0526_11246 [Lactobacillus jensenii JV-V16]KAA9244863.1 hypothetical protein F6I33_02260 [Lactobacillus jensenii]KAA9369838.1 hypothetical protein F6I25_00815 [Lactobacillus jensenii]KAA9371346.1 hypothetical protein F6I07_06595 [Lactobacillus jensenii]